MRLHPPTSILLNAAAVLCLCMSSPQSYAVPSPAVAADDEMVWFANLVRTNNGKTFCASLDTTAGQFADALTRFSQAHPELKGRVNDEQTIQALAESFPCKAQSLPTVQNTQRSGAEAAR